MKQTATPCAFTSSDSWVILSPVEQSIKRKIEAVGTPLKDWNIQINYGIKTGCNEAFIIDEARRTEILSWWRDMAERKRTEQIIRPYMRNCVGYRAYLPCRNELRFYPNMHLNDA